MADNTAYGLNSSSSDTVRNQIIYAGLTGGLGEAVNAYQVASNNALDRSYNAEQAAITREFNSLEAQKQRDFEERMSNTAYQRGVSDMKAAGLNPYAVYAGAQSASTPSGASASGGSSAYSHSNSYRVDSHIGDLIGLAGSALSMASSIFKKPPVNIRAKNYYNR